MWHPCSFLIPKCLLTDFMWLPSLVLLYCSCIHHASMLILNSKVHCPCCFIRYSAFLSYTSTGSDWSQATCKMQFGSKPNDTWQNEILHSLFTRGRLGTPYSEFPCSKVPGTSSSQVPSSKLIKKNRSRLLKNLLFSHPETTGRFLQKYYFVVPEVDLRGAG